MSLDALLIHTCTIENRVESSTTIYNNAVEAYATPITNVRCRLIEGNEPTQNDLHTNAITEGVVKKVYRLLINSSVDLQEKAKISSVTFEDGTVITDIFSVVQVLNRRSRHPHHKTATLERIL